MPLKFDLPSPIQNDRCGCYGQWRDEDQWVSGFVTAFNGSVASITTDQGVELKVPARRMTWKKNRSEWAVWSPQIDAIAQAAFHARSGDGRSRHNRRLVPGEYVRCQIGERLVGGFVCGVLIDGFMVTIPVEKTLVPEAGVNTVVISSDMLSYDGDRQCWQARHRKVKPQ
ncbi:hypothetical protein CcrC1_gp275 [Caulobacter phage C1]|nr:hypothetical protein CcrC1_gp275 [Caulobacter phage C1]UTU08504.1 hypothetical protein CcrC2_gp276 [Caulobacter phage C2]UTU09019.1 hypothetical protein CcrJ4_gp270 [Caulobacter phage J4]UTU09580.1 hypothetical protein CcrBL47_gp294 [Caulobacter phage BL47]UTU10137.1 hypothetical protein CcrRB23_gp275 [Caulobacter phage RB23]WGN97171.1 hypothetical protein [Bertelyvirus sp.]